MQTSVLWLIAAAVTALVLGIGIALRFVMTADPALRARETVAAVAQYGLLFGFAAVAAVISARGLAGGSRRSVPPVGCTCCAGS